MTLALDHDWLAAEPALVARLKDQVPELRGVFTASDTQSLVGTASKAPINQAPTPAAHVLYMGDLPIGNAVGQGEAQMLEQHWMIGLMIQNYRDPKTGAAARTQASALIPKVLKAINGWDPSIPGLRRFRRGGSPTPPNYADNGSAFFPMIFTARIFT